MERPRTTELTKTSRVITVAAISGLALMGCSADKEVSGSPEPQNERTSPAPESSESLPKSHEMVCDDELKSEPGMVVVDGRCDAEPSAPVGVYGEANQRTDALAAAVTGTLLPAECLETGDMIQDASGEGSKKWVKFDFGAAYSELDILAKNVGGGDVAYIPEAWVDGDERLQDC